jgi:hypothetical protein
MVRPGVSVLHSLLLILLGIRRLVHVSDEEAPAPSQTSRLEMAVTLLDCRERVSGMCQAATSLFDQVRQWPSNFGLSSTEQVAARWSHVLLAWPEARCYR